jgi:hypothetical protein
MKHFVLFVIAMMSFVSILATAQPSGSVRSSPHTYENGFIKERIYTNECLGFSYQIPAGWEINPLFGGANGKARNVGGWLQVLSLRRPNNNLGSISLEATSAAGKGANPQDFVFSQVEKVMDAPAVGRELIANAFSVEYSDRPFSRADYKGLPGYSGTSYTSLVYTKFRGFFVGAIITADSPKDLDQAADSLRGFLFGKDQVDPNCVMGPEETPTFGGGGIGSSMQ